MVEDKGKIYYSWKDYNYDMNYLIKDIKNNVDNPYIVGIFRGSLGMAAHISNVLDCNMGIIKYQTRDNGDSVPEWILKNIPYNSTVIIVDDIYDTGKTFEDISAIVPENSRYYALFENEKIQKNNNLNIFSVRHSGGKWIVFPIEYI